MNGNRIFGSGRGAWREKADALFWLNWRKFLAALLLWLITAAATWALFGLLDAFFRGLTGTDVVDLVRESVGGNGRVGVLTAVVAGFGSAVIPLYLLLALVYTIVRTQPRRRYLRLSWYTLLVVPAFFLGVVLHNLVYAFFFPYFVQSGGDEPVFFISALLGLPLYLILVATNTIIHLIKGRRAGAVGG